MTRVSVNLPTWLTACRREAGPCGPSRPSFAYKPSDVVHYPLPHLRALGGLLRGRHEGQLRAKRVGRERCHNGPERPDVAYERERRLKPCEAGHLHPERNPRDLRLGKAPCYRLLNDAALTLAPPGLLEIGVQVQAGEDLALEAVCAPTGPGSPNPVTRPRLEWSIMDLLRERHG